MDHEDDTPTAEPAPLPDVLELVLKKPVTHAKTEYTVLNLSEPTAGQLIKASKAGNALEQGATLIHVNAAVPMGVVEQLSQRDFDEAASFFARFSTSLSPPISA